jgi:hydroxymethylbilane synthase
LARAQARMVGDLISRAHPGSTYSLVEVATTGDVDQTSPVANLTEVGAFVRSVQRAVLDGRADVAVHSCKDLPVHGPDQLVAYYPERGAPWDVVCGSALDELPPGARVGTGSPRRTAQLELLRPDLSVTEVRGNIDTRLRKVEQGLLDAVILAEAGLIRAGMGHRIDTRLGLSQMVPAPAQGVLAVEVVAGSPAEPLVASIDHPPTRLAVGAERLLLANTGAGCRAALGALARLDGGSVEMWGFVSDREGPRRARVSSSEPGRAAEDLQRELGL